VRATKGTATGVAAVCAALLAAAVVLAATRPVAPGTRWVAPSAPGATAPSAGPPPAASPSPSAGPSRAAPVTGTGVAPFAFGTLVTRPERAAAESRRGVTVAMMELSWADYEPSEGAFDAGYAAGLRRRLAALRGENMQVTLGLGLHNPPAWVLGLPDSRFIDQRGHPSAEPNLVFNQTLRGKAERYLAQVDRDLGLENFWAVRLTSGGLSEVVYPGGGGYWAFDRNAQNGADRPPTMAPNPLPGWRPGDRSVSTAQVRQWADWYVHGLDDVVAWQLRVITSLGFRGYYQTLTPGSGTRPDGYDRDIAGYLPDGVTGVGAVWHRFYADLPDKRNVVAYVSSMADRSGGDDSCAPGDRAVAVTDPVADHCSAARWIARLARIYGLRVSGENPGWNAPPGLNPHYQDTGRAGMMAASIRQLTSCGYQGMYWAHDDQLWDGPASFGRYAALISATNGASTPPPPMP
jgi:Beta-galactosidase